MTRAGEKGRFVRQIHDGGAADRIKGAVKPRLIPKAPKKPPRMGTEREERPMRILLIEDDKEISEMLSSYLRTENFEVVCAADGQKACEAFDAGPYSIVLLDLMIPRITGMEVMKYIRQKKHGAYYHHLCKGFGFRQDVRLGAWRG